MLNEVAVVTTASDVSAECQAAPRCQAVPRALPGSPSLTITPALVSTHLGYSLCRGRGPRLDLHRITQTSDQKGSMARPWPHS